MNRSSYVALSLAGIAVVVVLALPACNSNQPVAPGSITKITPCSGVLGHNTVETGTSAVSDLWFDPVVPGSAATLLSLSVYTTNSSTTPVTFEAGVYSNSAGPASLLAETGVQTVNGPATLWNTASLSKTVSLSAGVTYWLAFQVSNNGYRYIATAIPYSFQPAGAYGSLPATFSGTNSSGYVFCLYGEACP